MIQIDCLEIYDDLSTECNKIKASKVALLFKKETNANTSKLLPSTPRLYHPSQNFSLSPKYIGNSS